MRSVSLTKRDGRSLTRDSGLDVLDGDAVPDSEPKYLQADTEFLKNFQTPMVGVNGYGPILNANANLIPDRADQYRDTSSWNDFKLNNGLGIARPYRKNDSIGGNTETGMYGWSEPSKMFGRDSKSYDLNFVRWQMDERARSGLKQMGSKPAEVPIGGYMQPWVWNDHQQIGEGGVIDLPDGKKHVISLNQYNRNYPVPDADAVARRLYQPAPSRLTKMLATDVEKAALLPNRTLLHPLKVVSEDRQRMKLQRVPKNADVVESVTYENLFPRGMASKVEAPYVFADPDVLRQPVGTNETGDRSVFGRWNNGYSDPLAASTFEDLLIMQKNTQNQVRGHDIRRETHEFRMGEFQLQKQKVQDPVRISVGDDFFHNDQDANTSYKNLLRQIK